MRSLFPCVCILGLLLVGCGRSTETITVSGSSTVAPLVAEIGQAFEASHAGVRVDVQTGGSSRGIADARSGAAAVGMVSRALTEQEADLRSVVIALDGIVLIAHAENPVPDLDAATVRALWRGEADRWEGLGGVGQVTVVHKAEGRSTLELFLSAFALANAECAPDVVIGDNEQGIKTVAANAGGVGYVSIGAAQVAIESGVPIRLVPLAGTLPTLQTVRSGVWPLARPLTLAFREPASEATRAFVTFAQSPAVDPLVRGLHFVPVER